MDKNTHSATRWKSQKTISESPYPNMIRKTHKGKVFSIWSKNPWIPLERIERVTSRQIKRMWREKQLRPQIEADKKAYFFHFQCPCVTNNWNCFQGKEITTTQNEEWNKKKKNAQRNITGVREWRKRKLGIVVTSENRKKLYFYAVSVFLFFPFCSETKLLPDTRNRGKERETWNREIASFVKRFNQTLFMCTNQSISMSFFSLAYITYITVFSV